jgi:hypothetical protein
LSHHCKHFHPHKRAFHQINVKNLTPRFFWVRPHFEIFIVNSGVRYRTILSSNRSFVCLLSYFMLSPPILHPVFENVPCVPCIVVFFSLKNISRGTFLRYRSRDSHYGMLRHTSARERWLVELCVSFAVLPKLLQFRSSRQPLLELQRDVVHESGWDLIGLRGFSWRAQELQSSREPQSGWTSQFISSSSRRVRDIGSQLKTSGIGQGRREVGRKTSSRRVKIKCALRAIYVVITVEDLL